MTLFRPQVEVRADRPTDSLTELLRRRIGTAASPVVDMKSAMTHSAVYECVDMIADLVAGFPVHRYRDVDGVRQPSTDRSVIDMPSTDDDPVNWRRILVVSWLLKGYAAGLVTGMDGARPTGIELVRPDRVTVERVRHDAPWQWKLDGRPIDRWPNGNLWVAAGKKMQPGDPVGCSVLEFAAAEVGLGLSSRGYGAGWFRDSAHPTGLLMNDAPVNEDGAKRVKQRFLDAMHGTREPAVFGDGWKYEQIQINPNESQFLETIKANRTTVAGFFKVPPHIIGAPSGDGMTYKNVEQDGVNLLRFCVGPWVNRMEATLNPLTPPGEYLKLNVDSLLRADLSTRSSAHRTAITAGYRSVNEVRALEDLPPIEGGDRFLWPPMRMQLTADELEEGADNTQEEPAERSVTVNLGEGFWHEAR